MLELFLNNIMISMQQSSLALIASLVLLCPVCMRLLPLVQPTSGPLSTDEKTYRWLSVRLLMHRRYYSLAPSHWCVSILLCPIHLGTPRTADPGQAMLEIQGSQDSEAYRLCRTIRRHLWVTRFERPPGHPESHWVGRPSGQAKPIGIGQIFIHWVLCILTGTVIGIFKTDRPLRPTEKVTVDDPWTQGMVLRLAAPAVYHELGM